jgi:ABC-2 type transport system ATP-binding protein
MISNNMEEDLEIQSQSAIKIEDLRRVYVTTKGIIRTTRVETDALKGISLDIGRGELFGLLGPNGAGKTTLIKILSTMLLPTSGAAYVNGYDIVKETESVRRCIGVVLGGERGLYYRLTAQENMAYWAALYRLTPEETRQRIPYLLELVSLEQRAHDRVETFSRGLKQRLHIARGLIASPKILFLDEPTIGLDPVAARNLRQIVGDLKAEGVTILLTTHQMQEAETLCDRVAFINNGEIVLLDTPHALTRAIEHIQILKVELQADEITLLESLQALPGIQAIESSVDENILSAQIKVDLQAVPTVLRELGKANIQRINSQDPSLEDVYIHLLAKQGTKI